MAVTIATTLLLFALIYLLIGFVFAIWFVFRKVKQLDEQTAGAPLFFRVLILPGSILLWIFLWKKIREKKDQ